jgi:hypothetical protein
MTFKNDVTVFDGCATGDQDLCAAIKTDLSTLMRASHVRSSAMQTALFLLWTMLDGGAT